MEPTISTSPDRHSFQKTGYIRRQEEKGLSVSQDYLDMFQKTIAEHADKFSDPGSRIDNMEYDLRTTEWILEKVRTSNEYAQNLYAAMCNNDFQKINLDDSPENIVNILRSDPPKWSCSWRYAGGIIADMRREGDYIDWYCSGIRGQDDQESPNYVGEGTITDEIREDLKKLSWHPIPENGEGDLV